MVLPTRVRGVKDSENSTKMNRNGRKGGNTKKSNNGQKGMKGRA